MSLASGTVLGPYTIAAPLGAGGMGEVYRARDTKLQRDVAIKVLPAAVAADPDRLARFEREAQVLAALNHPHIGAIYGLQESESVTALVLELVEGPTLADRIVQGALPLDEALPIARQIAEALEAAHEAGIVHRDLKPANIKVRPDGTVKVLDFGLAKALDPASGSGLHATGLANSPTITARGTEAGMILGTAAYMAPEQARGKTVDKRADIWAFGVVVFEMLTGHRLFEGETLSDTLAAVLTKTPDLDALPAATPPAIRHLVARCLQRDPIVRLRDIGEARLTLSATGAADVASSPVITSRRPVRFTTLLAAGLAGAVVGAAAWGLRPRPVVPAPLTAFRITPPPGWSLALVNRPALSISRDANTIVFVARREGVSRLFVKRRADVEARALDGTDGATGPVLSPDGRRIAFIANARLRLVNVNGGAINDIMAVNDERGHTWRDDRRLIVSPQPVSGLVEVSASGGASRTLTTLQPGERSHRWPRMVAGGQAVAFTLGQFNNPDDYDDSKIEILDLSTGARKTAVAGARIAAQGPDGLLLFARLGVLSALPFEAARLEVTGPPVAALEGIHGDKTTGASHFDYAADGTLIYVSGRPEGTLRRVVWADAGGRMTQAFDLPAAASTVLDLSLSPDARRVALVVGSGGTNDVWIHDVARRSLTRFTFGGNNATPVWSRDGKTIYYSAIEPSGLKSTVFRKPADGSRQATPVLELDARVYVRQVDETAGTLLVDALRTIQQSDIERIALTAGGPPRQALVATTFDETGGSLSPNGRWLAYASDETGRYEIYVRDVGATTGGRWQVSSGGGEEPRWSADGRRLHFRSDSRFMSATVVAGDAFEASTPAMMFDGAYEMRTDSAVTYSLDAASGRILMIQPVDREASTDAIQVLLNWDHSEGLRAVAGYNPASR